MLKEDCPQWVFDIQKKENYPDWLITLIVHNNLMFPSFILDRLKLNQYDEIFALNDISINKRSTSNYRLVKWCFEHSDYVICYWYDICVRAYEQKTITYIKKDMQKKPSKYINIATSETAQTLYKELELLDVGQKQVAQKRAQGMSYREIAEELGCSPNRAKLLHSAAVKHLIKLSKDKYKKQG